MHRKVAISHLELDSAGDILLAHSSGQEVDFVLEDRSGKLAGVEVKASATLRASDVRGLQALASATGKKWVRGVVLYTGTEVIPFGNNLHGVPITHLWAG